MRLSFECDEPVAVLSRVLDQIRRLGIGLRNLSAENGVVRMELDNPDPSRGQTLLDRLGQIGGIALLRREPGPLREAAERMACHV